MPTLNAPFFHDDDAAREYLEAVRWPEGAVCPHCGSTGDHYRLEGKGHRKGLLKCQDCRMQFSGGGMFGSGGGIVDADETYSGRKKGTKMRRGFGHKNTVFARWNAAATSALLRSSAQRSKA